MQVLARIQAHPARQHLWDSLADSLGLQTEISVHSSDPPNPWQGYRQALSGLPELATHVLVLQDDTHVCRNFGAAVEEIVERHGNMPVSLFLMPSPLRIARQAIREAKQGRTTFDARFRINEFCPVVGMIWPVKVAREFLDWVDRNPRRLGHPDPRSDDSVVGKWCANTHQTVRFTIPSLVQHMADQPSVKGGPTPASKMTAIWFAEDGSQYDW